MGRAQGVSPAEAAARRARLQRVVAVSCRYPMPTAILRYPSGALLVLAGPSGVGKSSFARRLLPAELVLSSDHMRALISGREDALEVSSQAFALLYAVAGRRLAAGRTVVVDSCALSPQAREDLAALAQDHKVSAHLLLLEGSRQLCLEGQRVRDRKVPVEAVEHHLAQQDELIKSIERRALGAEGFSSVIRLGRRAASAVERIDIV